MMENKMMLENADAVYLVNDCCVLYLKEKPIGFDYCFVDRRDGDVIDGCIWWYDINELPMPLWNSVLTLVTEEIGLDYMPKIVKVAT